MTQLRQRMLDAMVLRGLATRTQDSYVGAVAQLARHHHCSPEKLDSQQIQAYLLHLVQARHLARSSVNQAGCAFRFLYHTVLQRQEQVQIPLARAPQKLPEVLSRSELASLFASARHIKARTVLMTAYGCGLRVSELCHLQLADIDSHADRMFVRIAQGKGAKDRYVPLSGDVLQVLRFWWRVGRPQRWLFPAQTDAAKPLDVDSASRWYHAARTEAGITKQGGIHTLRHCYATHLLESGVDLHSLSQWLGHRHVSTTMRYVHLASPASPDGAQRSPLALLSALPERHSANPLA